MRELFVTTFLSVDGVMQAPGGPEEDPSDGFTLGGWSFGYFDDEAGARMDEVLGRPFDLLLGRRTYDIFAGYWPNATEDPEVAAPPEPGHEVRRLARQPGPDLGELGPARG